MLNGTNFKEWKENVLIVLGCIYLDLALRIEQPASLTAESSPDNGRILRSGVRCGKRSCRKTSFESVERLQQNSIPTTREGGCSDLPFV